MSYFGRGFPGFRDMPMTSKKVGAACRSTLAQAKRWETPPTRVLVGADGALVCVIHFGAPALDWKWLDVQMLAKSGTRS